VTPASVVDLSSGGQDFPANPPDRIYEPYAHVRVALSEHSGYTYRRADQEDDRAND
jgi:hypothetical protein